MLHPDRQIDEIHELRRKNGASENHLQFAIEALLFGALLALCTWPIITAASAISQVP